MHRFGRHFEDTELMVMVPDGLSKIPKPSRIKASESKFENLEFRCRISFYPDLARSAEKVSRSVKKRHGRVSGMQISLSGTFRGSSGRQVLSVYNCCFSRNFPISSIDFYHHA